MTARAHRHRNPLARANPSAPAVRSAARALAVARLRPAQPTAAALAVQASLAAAEARAGWLERPPSRSAQPWREAEEVPKEPFAGAEPPAGPAQVEVPKARPDPRRDSPLAPDRLRLVGPGSPPVPRREQPQPLGCPSAEPPAHDRGAKRGAPRAARGWLRAPRRESVRRPPPAGRAGLALCQAQMRRSGPALRTR